MISTKTSFLFKAGFKATGIYPFDPSFIPEEAYKPSELFGSPFTQTEEPTQEAETPVTTSAEATVADQSPAIDAAMPDKRKFLPVKL